jgi:hypothetical protein
MKHAPEPFYDVESFKFADIMRHWARERLVHELVVARELARGVIREGLRLQSVDPNWTKPTEVFRGYPLVGYAARPELPPIVIRAEALEHLLSVDRAATDLDTRLVTAEFVTQDDFRKWLVATGRAMPAFWYGAGESLASAGYGGAQSS